MTAPTTSALLLEYDKGRARTQQVALGWSDVGVCRKRAGYRLGGYEPTNESASMQAMLGTAIHDAVAHAIDEVADGDYLTEQEVSYAGVLGHLDRFHLVSKTLIDVKSTSSRWLEHIKLHGPDDPNKMQLSGYAAGLIKAGHDVQRIRIDYIARDTGEEYNWPSLEGAPVSTQWVREAVAWIQQVKETPLAMLPRDHMPESPFCANCPFRDPCWEGHSADREPLKVLYTENPDAAAWAEELWQAKKARTDAEKIEKRCRGALEAIRPLGGTGRVQAGNHTLDFRVNGIYFVSGGSPKPALGYDEEAVA